LVYDTGFNVKKDPIPHRCGAIMEHCILDESYTLWFCSVCRLVIGYDKDGKHMMKGEVVTGYQQKEYSDETIKDSQ